MSQENTPKLSVIPRGFSNKLWYLSSDLALYFDVEDNIAFEIDEYLMRERRHDMCPVGSDGGVYVLVRIVDWCRAYSQVLRSWRRL